MSRLVAEAGKRIKAIQVACGIPTGNAKSIILCDMLRSLRDRFLHPAAFHLMLTETMWTFPKVVAHRGGGKLAPENTMAALRCGLEHGFRAVEFDVMLSCDAVPILLHDDQLGRTVKGAGSASDYTAQQLQRMDAGSWFGQAFAGEPVPTYEAAYRFCAAHGIWMNVEIKPVPGFDRQTGRVVATLTRHLSTEAVATHQPAGNETNVPLLSSFSIEALQAAREAAPEIPRAWLVEEIPPDWQQQLQDLEAVALHVNHARLTAQLAGAVKAAGFGLFCYTVNQPERAREILYWGVDAFCTDRIDTIRPDFC